MRKISFFLFALTFAVNANAQLPDTAQSPNMKAVGEGRLTYMFWEAYDAKLYAPQGVWDEGKPFALTLHYLRDLEGADIADRSIKEMRKIGFNDEAKLNEWNDRMKVIFPDVKNGSVLTGVFALGKPTRFYDGNKELGVIEDPAFGTWFSGIWLSEKTSEPELRDTLLGGS